MEDYKLWCNKVDEMFDCIEEDEFLDDEDQEFLFDDDGC